MNIKRFYSTHLPSFLLPILSLVGLYLTSLYSYLLFHTLIELVTMIIAGGIFMMAWNTRQVSDNGYLLFIGISYLFVVIIDLVHTLAYKGMGIFKGYDSNLPTQLWIAARYVQSISLLIAPYFLRRKLNTKWVISGYVLVTSLLLTGIFTRQLFPVCYIEGTGLTPFKIISEYIISVIILAAIFLLLRNRKEFDKGIFKWLVASLILTIGAELAFTSYVSVFGFANLVGHFFKLIAFYLSYVAVIEIGLRQPYTLLFRNLAGSKELLQQAHTALQESESRFREVLENSHDSSYKRNLQTNAYEYLSPAFFRVSGYTSDEMKAMSLEAVLELMHPSDLPEINRVMTEAISDPQGNAHHVNYRFKHKEDGQYHWLHDQFTVMRDAQGQPVSLIGSVSDIAKRIQAEEEIRKLNSELEQRVEERTFELVHASRVKDEFLAMMSHELRTPLTSVLGYSETLLEVLEGLRGELNEKQKTAVILIHSSGKHLLDVINDVLDISKIQADKYELHPENLDPREICRSSLVFIKELALQKEIEVEFIPPQVGSGLVADPRRLKQVLINLLNNAVKFTPNNGKVKLEVTTDAQSKRMHFAVSDTGIGICAEDMPRLFQPFVQLDSKLSRIYAGTGLGLVLVKKMVEMQGGSVEVQSEFGVGSCFTFALPWEQKDEKLQPESENEGRSAPTATHAKVLIADDDKGTVMIIEGYLGEYGFQVFVAEDGRQVIPKVEEIMPDVILMDIQMPYGNGLDLTRRLRADPRFATIPIIALTAFAMQEDEERCLAAGMNEYMSKPVKLKDLKKLIERLLSRSEK